MHIFATFKTIATGRRFVLALVLFSLTLVTGAHAANGTAYYFDINGTAGGFYTTLPSGTNNEGDANWSTSAAGTATTAALPAGAQMTFGAVGSDFAGATFTVNMNGNYWVGLVVNSSSANITLNGTANAFLNGSCTWTVATGSTLTESQAYTGYGLNFNSQNVTLSGGGTISFGSSVGYNSSATITENMTGTVNLNADWNAGAANQANYTLTAGTLNFATANALNGLGHGGTLLSINGGTIDNTSGSLLTLGLGTGTYSLGGNFIFTGTSSLNFGTAAVALGTAVRTITVSANTLTLGGVISAGTGGGITKAGAGTLTLSGVNTYTAATTINAGKLVGQTGGSCASSAVAVTPTSGVATLGVLYTGANAQWSCSSLSFNAGGTGTGLEFAFGTAPSTTTAPLSISGTVTFSVTPTVTVDPAYLVTGTSYPLLVVGGTPPSSGVPTTATIGRGLTGTLAWGAAGFSANTLVLTVSGTSTEPLSWNTGGTGSGTWNINTSANTIWKDAGANTAYYQESVNGDQVVFDDSSSHITANTTVTLNNVVTPGYVTVNNSTYTYTISGSGAIAGGASLTKSGSSTLTLSTANAYTGGTKLSAGILSMGKAASLGTSGTIEFTGSSTLQWGASVTNDLSSRIKIDDGTTATIDTGANTVPFASALTLGPSGSGALTKAGSGTLTLSGNNTYTGATTLSAGILKLGAAGALGNGTLNTSGVTVGGSAILDLAGFSPTAIVPLALNSSASSPDSGQLENSTGSSTYGGTVSLGASTVVVGTTGTTLLFTNTITGNSKGLKKDGTGTLELTNSGTVTLAALAANRGTIQVDSGTTLNVTTITAGSGNSVGSGLTLNGGSVTASGAALFGTATSGSASGTLQINSGSTLTVPSLNKGGSAGASVVFNANFNGGTLKANGNSATFFSGANNAKIQSGGLTVDDGGNAITISQTLIEDTGSTGGGLSKQGAGTLTLSGANTFTGGLTVNNGTVSFASDGSTGGTGYPLGVYPASTKANSVTLNGGGLLDTATATIAVNRGITLGASGGTLDASANQTLTVNSIITGTGGLTKGANTGTVILAPSSGNNNYVGQTTISGGKLVVQSSQTSTGNFTVADGADLTVTVSGSSQLSPNTLTLGTTTGATLEFSNDTSTSVAPINAGTISSGGTLTIKVNSGTFTAGQTYPLITWTTGSAPTVNLSSMLALGVTAHLVSTSTSLSLAVDSVLDIWIGGSSGNWDTVATGNWTGLHTIYADGDPVLFDDTATGTTNVTVNQVVQPSGIVVNNITKTYTLTSAANKFIGGTTGITKTGGGTLTLSGGLNTNTGVIAINGGMVSVSTLANGGSASDIGSSANAAANLTLSGGTLQYAGATASSDRLFSVGTNGATIDASGTGALNLNNTGSAGLSGSGARTLTLTGTNTAANKLAAAVGDNGGTTTLIKSGAGSWTLSGANSYSGTTILSAGTLALTGSGTLGNGSSALTVGGGTLDLGGLTSPAVGPVSITNVSTIQNGSLTGVSYLDSAAGTVSITAGLLGSASLNVSGGGTLGLSGANLFTGVTVVGNGTVNLLNDQRGMTGGLLVSTNNSTAGTLNIGSASQTAATLALVNSGNLVQVGNNTAGGTAYGIINVVGTSAFATTVTNKGSLWIGRQSQFNVNAYGNWLQNGDFMEQEQGGYWANFTVAANGSFTYAGVNPINLTVGGNVNDNLTIAGTFTTGQGFNFNNLGTGYPVIVLNSGGMLALSASIPLLMTNTGTGAAGQLQLGTGGGVFNTAGFSTAIGLGIMNYTNQTGSLTKSGLGTLTLSGTNTYTGATTVSAGTLTIDTTGVIGGGASGSAITVNGGTLTDNSTVATTGGIAGTSSLTISSGTANLNTANNYSGATSVTGTLLAADANAFKNSAVTLNNGGTLQLRNNSPTLFAGTVKDSGAINASTTIDVNNSSTGANNMLTLTNGYSATEPSSGNLAGTYTTTLNVTGGNGYTLALPQVTYTCGASYGSGSSRNYVLDLNPTTANVTIGNLSLNAGLNRVGLYLTLDGNSANNVITGVISGTAVAGNSVTKTGTGTWTLSGNNTYTGGTTISAGTLALSGSGSLASPTITVAGGATFDVSGLSSTFTLGSSQTLANSGSTTANLVGNINTGSGTNLLTFAAGTPAFNIAGGTLNLSGSTVKVNNTGPVLGAGSYKLIGALSGGAVAVTLPAVSVTGGGTAGLASLQVIGGELYLNVVIPTALTLVSTPAGTNGYLDNVLFSAAVLTNGVAATNATGTVQFFTNGVVLVTNGLAGGTTNCSLSTLPRGTNLIAAVYSGDANYLPSTNNLYQVVTNHPPMAGNASYTRNQGIYSMRIPVAELLTNVTDADSDTITLVSTDVSSNGVTLLTVAVAGTNYLYYYSTNNIGDQFDYTVTDGFGGTNTGTVLMNLNATPVFGQDNVQLVSTNGGVQLTFFGVPGNTYVVQRNLTLDSGNWQDLNTNSATTSNPVMVITDTNNSQAFYRLRWLSSP